MNIIVVGDENASLFNETRLIQSCAEDSSISLFNTAVDTLKHAMNNEVDVAFINAQLKDESGIDLAKQLRKINSQINIIFSTDCPDYYADAMEMHASGYLLKPLTRESITRELKDLRYPVRNNNNGLTLRCFGTFEAFYNGNPIKFKYNKSKEMLAYLIDRRGSSVTNEEVKSVLWDDDKSHDNYYKQIRKDLFDTLEAIGCSDIIIKWRNSIAIDRHKVKCDYYSFLNDPTSASFYGEYMKQYEWAIYTSSFLERKYNNWTGIQG